MLGAIVGVVGIVAAGAAYLDRKNLKADAANLVSALENKEAAVKAELKGKLATIVADVKAWASKEEQKADAVIAQVEARIKQIL